MLGLLWNHFFPPLNIIDQSCEEDCLNLKMVLPPKNHKTSTFPDASKTSSVPESLQPKYWTYETMRATKTLNLLPSGTISVGKQNPQKQRPGNVATSKNSLAGEVFFTLNSLINQSGKKMSAPRGFGECMQFSERNHMAKNQCNSLQLSPAEGHCPHLLCRRPCRPPPPPHPAPSLGQVLPILCLV